MRFGIFTSMGTQSWPGIVEFWQHLEKTGWDIACVTDHFMPNTAEREGAVMEAWSTLCALAVQGGPKVLAAKGAILGQHCAALGRDPGGLSRSANMVLKITNKQSEAKALGDMIAARMGPHAADAHDTCLAGSADQIRDTLGALKESGADTVFLPTMFSPADVFKADSDEFISNIATEFRS